MLLLYLPILMGLGAVFKDVQGELAASMRMLVGVADWNYVMVIAFSALFSSSFFIGSLVRKNPQIQFFIEFIIAACIVIFSPVY
ncbi:hypothetical protein SAMN03080615_01829 [Amphritea atlantica]|uniref:Uncharacterized protein n=1 Tax=Amphritea atlantica TaxID=355243 RepID=A0A1H9GQG4_9GAMM|nr:hypothetical protein SAMN03080615_01829 [Amphritea atlantica]